MLAKTSNFEADLQDVATFAKALGHPARAAIVQHLAQNESCICGEIVDVIPLAQATVSRHLKTLKEAGLVKGEIDGPRSCYCLDAAGFARFAATMRDFLDGVEAHPIGDQCCP
ncbi:MAG: winged helix-turn-helix transcriptional regulator [Bacteroidetes bacterium]|nr:winged helix-turn-helix transcriptional regulator [Bacteroidota bacterium]